MNLRMASTAEPLTDRVREHAESAPDKPAAVSNGRVISYGSLLARAGKLERTLSGLGPTPRVGILAAEPVGLLVAFLAAGLAGGTAIVYDPRWTWRQQHIALEEVSVDIIVADDAGRRRLRGIDGSLVVVAIPSHGHTASKPAPSTGEHTSADFYVGFTSGTSGNPKAYSRNHASWLASFELATRQFAFSPSDWVLVPGPLHHSLFLFGALHCLWMGATACLLPRFHAGSLARSLQQYPLTRLWAVPTMLTAAEPHLSKVSDAELARVKGVYCTGSGWHDGPRRRCEQTFFRAEVVEFYGASELSFVAFSSSWDSTLPSGHLRPFRGVELSIRPEPATPDKDLTGRIYVRSPMLFSRYLSPKPEAFAQDGAGWVTVGDVGHLGPEGTLKLTGRVTSTLICGGRNIQPEPIENCLEQLEEVAEAAVVGVPDRVWGERPVALVRWRGGERLSRATLSAHCRRELASGARPHDFRQVDKLPRTGTGKIARSLVQHQLSTGDLPAQVIA